MVSNRGTVNGLAQRVGFPNAHRFGTRRGLMVVYGHGTQDSWHNTDLATHEATVISDHHGFPTASLSDNPSLWGNSAMRTNLSTLRSNVQGYFGAGVPGGVPVYDNFNRPDEGPPPSTKWDTIGASGLSVVSNVAAPDDLSPAWNVAQTVDAFVPPCGVTVDVLQPLDASGDAIALDLLTDHSSLKGSGYDMTVFWGGTNTKLQLFEYGEDFSAKQLGTDLTIPNVGAGDSLALTYDGAYLRAWHKPATGAWTLLQAEFTTTWASALKPVSVWLKTADGTHRLDNVRVGPHDARALFAPGPVHLLGFSAGGTAVLNWAKNNPTLVKSIVLVIPCVDIQAIHAENRSGFAAEITSAYGGAPPDADNPIDYAADLAGIPIRLYYSTTDTVTLEAEQKAFAAASGAELVSMGALGHLWGAPYSGEAVASFLREHD